MNKELLMRMVEDGFSASRIAIETYKGSSTVRRWLARYGITTRVKNNGKRRFTDEEFAGIVRDSTTMSDVLRKMGLKVFAGNYETVMRRFRRMKLSNSHMIGKASGRGGATEKRLEDVLRCGSEYSRRSIKKRLLKAGLLKNECVLCGQGSEWKGNPLVMVLDHINGINNDHRLENLRMLCPNCNSQQDTFTGRNKRKDSSVGRAQL